MRLADLAAGVRDAAVVAGGEAEIAAVTQDSRRAAPGALFVAVRGARADGHSFAAAAAAAGAAVAFERPVALPAGTPCLRLPDTRTGLAELAAALQGRPSRRLLVAGVTGTDGKTTTTHMAAHLLEAAGLAAGALSTVAFTLGGEAADNPTGLTTADAVEVQGQLARMAAAGARAAVVEATSHALVQGRVAACDFDVAAFTHVGRDHLDYHATWEEYLAAKARLIDLCAAGWRKGVPKTAILNRDDEASWEALAGRPIERRWSYSIRPGTAADLRAEEVECGAAGCRFRLRAGAGAAPVSLSMPARFNVSNALCAAGIGVALGLDLEAVAAGLSTFPGVRGRLEAVDLGQPFRVYVDFAHAAGALATALAELRPLTAGRLLAVFGSTARSDHDRPGMGRAAATGADRFWITTDDPLDEDPATIAGEVAAGAAGAEDRFEIVLDRRQAIRRALALAGPGDAVLLAGKGHERTMITAQGKGPWDERAEAEAALRELGFGS
ncbi:MAG: UDP-N-acetylmuramoyl-L-alanyl-D-glutamate--2,6-diaminopimelate ligase [Candidatus Dormibacteraceae bacterium]